MLMVKHSVSLSGHTREVF